MCLKQRFAKLNLMLSVFLRDTSPKKPGLLVYISQKNVRIW